MVSIENNNIKGKNDKYLGIDIGGTTAKYAIITGEGKITGQSFFETGFSMEKDEFMSTLLKVVSEAVKNNNISGVGICTLGIVNPEDGEVLGGNDNMPALKSLKLKKAISGVFPKLPVVVMNDVNAMAYGEQWLGAAQNCSDFFCVALGTGLGGCAVVNSKILDGSHFHAGEIGYLDYNGESEYCEKYISTKFVMEEAAALLGVDSIDGFEFFDRIRKGDSTCLEVFDRWTSRIARLIANIIIILDPEKVIIGGGVSREGETLVRPIRDKIKKMLPHEFNGQTSIVAAKCANNAGMLGVVWALMKQEAR